MRDHPWKNTKLRNLHAYTYEEFLATENGHKIHSAQRDTRGSFVGQNESSSVLLPSKSLRDIVEEAAETPEWILQDILKAGELTLLDGMAKLSGKTTLVMHGLKAVRDEEPFLGYATKRARILYLCEQGNNFKEAIEDAELDLDDDGFKVVQWRDAHDIPWPILIGSAVVMCKEEEREILVCDTFAAFSGLAGTEENNSGDIKQKMEPLKRAANIEGLAVLTTRHSGKDGKGRGSSQFEAEADILVSLKRKDGQAPETVRDLEIIGRYGIRRLNIDKTQDGYDNLGSDNRVAFVKALRTIKAVLPTRTEDALTEAETLTLSISKGHKVTRTTGQRALEWLVEQGTAVRIGHGVKNDPFRYRLKIDPQFFLPNDQSLSGQKERAVGSDETKSDRLGFSYIVDAEKLSEVHEWIQVSDRLGIDLETTGLDPDQDRICLLQLGNGETTYVLDALSLDIKETVELLDGKTLLAHNADFEKKFVRSSYGIDLTIEDTLLMAQVLEQGDHPSMHTEGYALEAVCERYLSVGIDKTEQRSDWAARPLTDSQLAYAAKDAQVMPGLHEVLMKGIHENGLAEVLDIETRAAPAFRWMEETGVYVDAEMLKTYISSLEEEAEDLRARLKEFAHINWGSGPQLIEFFGLDKKKQWPKTDKGAPSTKTDHLRRLKHPAVKPLLELKKVQKNLSTYGERWLARIVEGGRLHAKFLPMGTVTGRTTCTSPNLQNIPHDTPHRAAIMAPEGRVLIKADYSQIELRIAAKLVPDQTLLDLYVSGEVDAHTRMASIITGKPETEVTRAERAAAKAANFGPLYGAGAKTLRETARKAPYFVEWSLDEAKRILKTFKETYPGIAAWHRTGYTPHETNRSELAPTRTLAGRRRSHFKSVMDWFNSPIQGTGADGAKLAMALLYERRSEVPSMAPILFVHDEIVIECDERDAASASELLVRCMRDGMNAVLNKEDPYVPVVVDVEAPRKSWA